ncbi:MAG: UDP-glucose 4-epimerase GalE [Acidiferrobacterales bacterium]|nr:UDP-glucose 4-epimerase GalE [Acidiferrobacterales bacterium]
MNKILVTGGAGYIGSHTCVELLEQGYEVLVLDNFCNSSKLVLDRVEQITGLRPKLVEMDTLDSTGLDHLFSENSFEAVVHFAGLKAVGESVQQPRRYYQNNVQGSLELLKVMEKYGTKKLVFSSSATVYGDPASVPITEDFPLSTTNPYGESKLIVENILRDIATADQNWQISILRYFNPVAAHPSGLIGEHPNGIPNNLMPYIAQVAVGKLEQLAVFGNDYPTPDGSGVRDYIHVVDLARAHLKALEALKPGVGCRAYNIGTGQGYSVIEMIKAFEHASGKSISYKVVDRRPGDIAECYADTALSLSELGWRAEYGLEEMMEDHWNWQKNSPNGYESN